jgi:O-antigen/teichoic acid export membrane protein
MRERLTRAMRTRFARDTLWLQAGRIGMTLLAFGSSLIVWRLLGAERFGVYGLALSLLALFHTFDLTGLHSSTASRLAVAFGADDRAEARDLVALHLMGVTLVHAVLTAAIALIGGGLAAALHGDPRIGTVTLALAGAYYLDALYGLVITTLQARRAMRIAALAGLVNQAVLSAALVAAAWIDPRAESLVIGRYAYAAITLLFIVIVYARVRARSADWLPTYGEIFARVGRVNVRRHWRFGLANALDKNLGDWFVQVPVQLVGAVGGTAAAGYLNMAMTAVLNANILTSALFENLRTVIPQTVGRGDYAGLWRGLRAALVGLAIGGIALYSALAIGGVVFIPMMMEADWRPAVPVLAILCLYGAITTTVGVLGPVYRALDLMRQAITAKGIALIVLVIGGIAFAAAGTLPPERAAVYGAALIAAIFAVQGAATAWLVIPQVRRRAA